VRSVRLGRCGITASALGLGAVKIGRREKVKYPQPYELPSDDTLRELFAAALDSGVDLIDTAPAYGTSEERIGRLMRAESWFGSRAAWIVSTKAGEFFAHGESTYDFRPETLKASVHESCRRLGTDYLDIVLLHAHRDDAGIMRERGALDTLLELRGQGVIRAAGLSAQSVEGGLMALEAGADVLMITLNADDLTQLPLVEAATSRDAGILVKKALLSGHIAGGEAGVREALRAVLEATPPERTAIILGTASAEHLRADARIFEALAG
jgi:aryl-alcohol dehydrogenase-like predicted oxidoreductase